MATENEYLIAQIIADKGLPELYKKNVMAGKYSLVDRTHEADWSKFNTLDIGTKVTVPMPIEVGKIDEFDRINATVEDKAIKRGLELKIEKHFYKKLGIDTQDLKFNSSRFFQDVVNPVMHAFSVGIEEFVIRKMFTGTYKFLELAGNPNKDDLVDISMEFTKMLADEGKRKIILGSKAAGSVKKIDDFTDVSKRANDVTIKTGEIGSYLGMDFYTSLILDGVQKEVTASVSATTFATGTLKAAIKKNADGGVITLTLPAKANSGDPDRVIKKYTIIKLGEDMSFVAAKDAVESSLDIQVEVEYIGEDVASGVTATVANVGNNFAFTPDAFLLVQISPLLAIGAADSGYAEDPETNANIRVTAEYGNDFMKTNCVWDTFIGGRVAIPSQYVRF